MMITIYTDGACSGNPGPGGWAAIILGEPRSPARAAARAIGAAGADADDAGERVLSGGEPKTTNQRMELMAALAGLVSLSTSSRVEVVSDSLYLVNCFRQRWWVRWERDGWLNSKREPVANRDLWERLLAEAKRHDVTWRWVRGHDGDPLNERADALARAAVATLR